MTVLVDFNQLDWESFPADGPADPDQVRWKLLFSADRTQTSALSIGIAQIAPGGELPRHRHRPPEAYYCLSGSGAVDADDGTHALQPGRALFVPSSAWHRTRNTGSTPLVILFAFPTDSFEDVHYDFDAPS